MPRWLQKLLLVAMGVAVLAGAVGLVTARWLERTLSAEGVATRASAAIGQDVRIRSLSVHFTPWLRVRLQGLTVGSDAAVEAIEIGPRLLPLLRGRAEAGRIEIEGARLRLIRSEAGDLRFGEAKGPTSPGAPELGRLPEIEISAATIELVDRAGGGEPVRTWLQLSSFSLEPSLLTGEAELQGTIRVGTTGDRGELRVEATARHDGTFEVSIEAGSLDLALLRPYLERFRDLDRLEGRVAGELALRTTQAGEAEANASLRLTEATVGVAGAALTGPALVEAQLRWQDGALELRNLHFTTRSLTLPRGERKLDQVEITAEAFDLAGLPGWADSPARAELRDLSLAFDTLEGPVSLHVGAGRLESLAEAGTTRLSLEATLGPGPERSIASIRAESVPFEPSTPLASLPFDVALEIDAFDPAPLLPYLPSAWQARMDDARIAGTATLSGNFSEGFRGETRLALRSGALELGGIRLEGSASVEGALAITRQRIRLDAGQLEAEQASMGDHVASGFRAQLSWNGDTLELTAIDLDSYDGLLLAATEEAAGPELHVTRAERFSAFGKTGPWPLSGLAWLRVPSQASVVAAEASLMDPRSSETEPLPFRIEQAELRGFALGETVTLGLRADLGAPAGSRGTIELEGTLGPLGDDTAALSLEGTARGIDPALALAYAPPGWPVSGALGPLDGGVSLHARPGRPLEADITFRAASGSLLVGGLQLAAPLHGRGIVSSTDQAFSIREGHLETAGAALGNHQANALRADFAIDGTTLSLQPIAWRAYHGSWQHRGTVTLTDPPVFDLSLSVDAANADQLMGFDAAEEPMRLSGQAELRGIWHGIDRWLEDVEGSGTLELRGGSVPGSGLIRAVWNALLNRAPDIGLVSADQEQPSRTRLQRANLPFQVRQNRLRTDAFELITDDYTVNGEGRLSQSFDVRLNGEVQLNARGISKMLSMGGIPKGLRKGLRLPAIPIEGRGPPAELAFRADVRKIPLATLYGVLGLPARASDAVKGVGGAVRDLGNRALGRKRSRTGPDNP